LISFRIPKPIIENPSSTTAKHDTGLQLAALNDISLLWAQRRSLIRRSRITREREMCQLTL